ncbi:MAG: hypothetical protein JWR67_742 [Mucilaginibacter sp.]|nr:hypothetical protein [Mucilaginibacter sp.]
MENHRINLLRSLFALSDLMLLNICLFASHYLSNKYGSAINHNIYLNNIFICNAAWVLSAGLFKLYSKSTIYKFKNICNATWKCILLHSALTCSYMLLTSKAGFPLNYMLSFYGLTIISFFISRFACIAFEKMGNLDFDKRNRSIMLQ